MDDKSYLKPLIQNLNSKFDHTLRAAPDISDAKGWGQFLSSTHIQVGAYGTCAGLIVKTICASDSHIDIEVENYLKHIWANKSNSDKHFSQTVRLSFFIMSLTLTRNVSLVALHKEAVDELLRRQHTEGGWGDWGDTDSPQRVETTAWAVLALMRCSETRCRDSAERGARHILKKLLASPQISSFDSLPLGVILHVLKHNEITSRIIAKAVQLVYNDRPSNEALIHFFDYKVTNGAKSQMKRDFLCTPRFFLYSLIVSSPALRERTWSSPIQRLKLSVSHRRAYRHLVSILQGDPVKTSNSMHPSTVDQAFSALSAEYIDKHLHELERTIKILGPIYRQVKNGWISRFIIPLPLVAFFGSVAQDPKRLVELSARLMGGESPELKQLVAESGDVVQYVAIFLGFLLGQPLLNSFFKFLKEKINVN